MLSEIILLAVTQIRSNQSGARKADNGSIFFVIFGFWCSICFSFFSIRKMPGSIRNLLLPNIFAYIGTAMILLGMIVRWISIAQLNRAFTFGVQTAKDQHLVTTGMYRLVRNPAYSGSILSLLGIALALRSILSVIAVLIVCLVCYEIRIHTEEKALKAAFDEEFSSYCTHTKRLVPFIW